MHWTARLEKNAVTGTLEERLGDAGKTGETGRLSGMNLAPTVSMAISQGAQCWTTMSGPTPRRQGDPNATYKTYENKTVCGAYMWNYYSHALRLSFFQYFNVKYN
jgi:hypothetical protein